MGQHDQMSERREAEGRGRSGAMDNTLPPASPTERLQPLGAREPIDVDAIVAFLAAHVPDPPRTLTVRRFGGGSSNLTYLLSDGAREWVLRRPPPGPLLPTAHDMAREFRVISALTGTNVPVARPIALCTDPALLGAPFYLMERRRGFVVRDEVPPELGDSPARRQRASLALIEAMAKLHTVDWRAVGLADGFGKPSGYVERQLNRWHEQWARSKTTEIADLDRLEEWLRARVPVSPATTIVHGDFRLENCLLDPHSLDVVAIFDWEMSTLGDPLADLGWTLAYWPGAGDPPIWRAAIGSVSAEPGFPGRDLLVAHYQHLTGFGVDDIRFYEVLALYKLTIIAQGIYRRARNGQIPAERIDEIAARVGKIAAAGRAVAEGVKVL